MSGLPSKPCGVPVAIVGIGCRFPGGVTDTESFWRLLSEAREGITEIPRDRIDVQRYFDPKAATPGRMMSRWGGFLDRINEFDADFFGVSPREAERLDPQQRLLLETSWEALEDAGQDVRKLEGTKTGVFIGQWTSDFEARLFAEPEVLDFYMTEGSGRYASSGRISYTFGLRGPSLTIDTACSSSLVAVHLAVQSIRGGESQAALVGGVNIILQPQISIAYSQSRMMSEDGRCKFGDASGDGYVRSEGVAVVFLKALDRAVADDDRIYAVIRGSAINNDGHSSGSLGRPSQTGQEEVLRAAYRDAGLPAGRVQYIEAHGTGTRAGDPVELNALNNVVRETLGHNHPIHVGSAKTNFGHTEAAAGLAGLIKTALALRHGIIPPSLHCNVPNPAISWANMPFVIPSKPVEWLASDGPRIAGVTGFGIAGTNAHVVLEEAPIQTGPTNAAQIQLSPLLPLSAKSPKALRQLAARFADMLGSDAQLSLDDVCWTAATRRTPLEHRAVFVAADRAMLVEMLRAYAEGAAAVAEGTVHAGEMPRIGFVCPGQGAQWVGMARQLIAEEPEFLAALKRCDQAVRSFIDWSIVDQLTLAPDSPQYRLERIDAIQPVLVAIAIAYAALLRSFGIEPAATVGHSMGEVAAACIADVISLEQAMRVICRRSALMQKISGQGAMALVELSTDEAATRLVGREDRLSVAVNNSPRSSVISGDPGAMQQLVSELERDNVFCRLVKVDVASHSPQTAPLADQLVAELDGLVPGDASIPLWSTVLGRRADGHEFDAVYWGRNLRETVRFTDAINGMLNDGISAFVELGPHPVLLHSISQTSQSGGYQVALAACGRREDGDRVALLSALGRLWAVGCPIDWSRTLLKTGRVASLPHYPWQRERHWVATAELDSAATTARTVRAPIDQESRDWLFNLNWEASDLRNKEGLTLAAGSCWLIIAADTETGSAVAAALRSAGAATTTSSIEHLETAIEIHAREASSSSGIVVVAPDSADAPYLPVRVLQAVLKMKWSANPKLWLVTRGGQPSSLNGSARVSVNQAALWGAARVVGEEHPELWGGLVDFDPVDEPRLDADQFVRHLMIADGEDQIALRHGRRHVLRLVPATRDSEPEKVAWRRDAAYLITGGLGHIGLQMARTLAASGVRRLILMGRTPLPPREEWSGVEPESQAGQRIAAIRALETTGLSVHLAAVDVSDEAQLRKFLDRYAAEAWPPIRGVIHAAASFENALAGKMDRATFERVVGTKLRSAQLFDQLLPGLDVFILFSSMGGFLTELHGIANYAAANVGLDALAHDRRARGLPAISIAWGPWENVAAGSLGTQLAAELTRQGIQTLAPERCTKLCTWLCNHSNPFVAVLAIDWKKFGAARSSRDYPIFRNILSRIQDREKSEFGLSDRIARATPEERRLILDGVVRKVVSSVLKITPSRLEPRRAMGTMGLTSLMALEIRNRLEVELRRPLSATLAWNYPTIDALVTHLAGADLEGAEPGLDVGPTKPPDADLPSHIKEVMDLSDEQAVAALRNNENSTGVASAAYHND